MKIHGPEWLFADDPLPDPHGKGARAVAAIEKLTLPSGKLAGQPFILPKWQRRLVTRIYGDTDADGKRRIRQVIILLPRKQGKTTLSAALTLLHLAGPEREQAGEVILAASDRGQASIAFKIARLMITGNPTLAETVNVVPSLKEMEHIGTGSVLKAISHEAYSKHGMNISMLLADEVHAWPNRELWDVLETSMGAREQPLTVAITTAGIGVTGLDYELIEYARKVERGDIADPSVLPVLFEAPADCDIFDEDVWRSVNPALACGYMSISYLQGKAKRAREIPSEREPFKRLHLNIRSDGAAEPFFPMDKWDACRAPIDIEALAGRECWVAIDLSSNRDLTAVVAAFPEPDGTFVLLAWFWLPEAGLRRRAMQDRSPYMLWHEAKQLLTTPGNVIDQRIIEQHLRYMAETYQVREFAFDPWAAKQIQGALLEDGLPVVSFRQGTLSMSPAIKELEALLLSGRIRHNGDPVLRNCMAHAVVEKDKAENLMLSKAKARDRIDGAVAACMAVSRAAAGEDSGSRWNRPNFTLTFLE